MYKAKKGCKGSSYSDAGLDFFRSRGLVNEVSKQVRPLETALIHDVDISWMDMVPEQL